MTLCKNLLIIQLLGILFTLAFCSTNYPLFRQCDTRWGNNRMGGNATICAQGCAMSCVAMAIAGKNILINGNPSDPDILNSWLIANNGYKCINHNCNNLVINAPDRISNAIKTVGEIQKPDLKTLKIWLEQDTVVIAHVKSNSHFVLLTQPTDSDLFKANDPFYSDQFYPYANITDVIVYEMKQQKSKIVLKNTPPWIPK